MDKIFETAVDEKTWSVPVLLPPVFESRLFLDPTAYSAKEPYITDNKIVIADFLAALGYQVAGLPAQPASDGDGSDSGKGNIPAVVANGSVIDTNAPPRDLQPCCAASQLDGSLTS